MKKIEIQKKINEMKQEIAIRENLNNQYRILKNNLNDAIKNNVLENEEMEIEITSLNDELREIEEKEYESFIGGK